MKLIETQKAVGHVLCHDLTQIIRGVTKDARFRKGHVVTEEDIPVLLSMGKEHLYIWERDEHTLHEDEAALRLCTVCQNKHMHPTQVKEGKIELIADCDGLFRVDVERLGAVNRVEDVIIAVRHTDTAVRRGDKLAATRVIPLVIPAQKLARAEAAAGDRPLLELLPFVLKTAGIIVTGSEIQRGIIEDAFSPVLAEKLKPFGIAVTGCKRVGDDREAITGAILEQKRAGADMILCTGGMSVDPDDRTPAAIRAAGVNIVTYGAPVLPGAMFLMSYFDDGTPVIGLPGCVMYAGATVFDLVLPRIAAGETLTKENFAGMGHGGLCLGCGTCRYPVCPFGKGGVC